MPATKTQNPSGAMFLLMTTRSACMETPYDLSWSVSIQDETRPVDFLSRPMRVPVLCHLDPSTYLSRPVAADPLTPRPTVWHPMAAPARSRAGLGRRPRDRVP